MGQSIPPTLTINVAHLTAIWTIFNVFSYDAMSGRDYLPDNERIRCVLSHGRLSMFEGAIIEMTSA